MKYEPICVEPAEGLSEKKEAGDATSIQATKKWKFTPFSCWQSISTQFNVSQVLISEYGGRSWDGRPGKRTVHPGVI